MKVVLNRQCTIERKAVSGDVGYVAPDSTYGTERVVWVPLVYAAGSPPVALRFWCEAQAALPSRSEAVVNGLAIARNLVRIRMRYRNDIDSSMRVLLHGDSDDEVLQIIGGPAEIGGRKTMIEMMCERITT